MREFSVWAPEAKRVELATGGERRPMRRTHGGWWRLEPPDLGDDVDYAYAVDGGEPRPDPRSRWQPEGVHGPSRRVDLSRLEWTVDWRGFHLPSAVLYELHIGTFTPEGTFAAAMDRLDHLVELGVDAVSLMPVNAFPGRRGWGYDGVALWAVHHPYGGPAGLAAFVDACHARGLGVILDVVYNHLGPSGNYLAEFGPYFTDRYATPWGLAVNLDDRGSDEVRRFIIENALMWLRDYRIDGLRLDAVHAIVDTSAVHILEELAAEVDRLAAREGRPLWVIAESDLNDPRLLWSTERGGYGLHAQWSDDFHHALHAALTGDTGGYYADFGRLEDIATALRNAYVYDGRYSAYRRRRHGRPAGGLPGQRFLGYLQNHDQVGNRAVGDRIAHVAGIERQKIGAALVLTSPFVPMLFQGEEWAASSPFQYFTDHAEPELARAVREGRRSEFAAFGWAADDVPDPQDPETWSRSVLRWEERTEAPHAAVEAWYRALLDLRRRRPELRDGRRDRVHARADDQAGTLVVRRGDLVVCCNFRDEPRTMALEPEGVLGPSAGDVGVAGDAGDAGEGGEGGEGGEAVRLLLASRDGVSVRSAAIRMPPLTVAVLELA